MIEIQVRSFTKTPGTGYFWKFNTSGITFRKLYLEEHFKDTDNTEKLKIILDGTEGYPTSFLRESFGHLAYMYGVDKCLSRLEFESEEDPLLIEEIMWVIEGARNP